MQDRHRYRAWDTVENRYIYNAEMVYDTRGVVAECFGYMLDGTYGDRYIVEQCIGLKDKNGKLIYEGDIVEYNKQKYIVVWREDLLGYYFYSEGIISSSVNIIKQGKLISNIHENPELLEKK